jgi:hypothetical protein
MSPAAGLAVRWYTRPRLRRAFKVGFTLWFAALWAVAAAPTAAADSMPLPNIAFANMQWTGLQDTYGVPISFYRVSMVGPLEAAGVVMSQELQEISLFDPSTWVTPIIGGSAQGINNISASALLGVECALLIFIAGTGIWFLQFAISAPWLQWLAAMAQPVVSTLQTMVNHYLVMSFALLASILYGAYVWLARGKGQGLGIIAGGLGIMALFYLFFNNPIGEMLGPNGVMSIGRYLGFEVAEGAIHNGALAPGNGGAQLATLTSLLCTALVRNQIQMINFGTVIDDIPGCAYLWSTSIMGGQQDGPVHAMGSCDPAALAYAEELGLPAAGLFAVVLFVEFWIMVALLWIGWHVIYNGFKSFWRLLILVPAVPLSVAPGGPRRFGKRQVVMAIHDGIEFFASIAGLAIIAIMDGSVLAGGPPGSRNAISSPLGREIFVLLITLASSVGYHRALISLRNGVGFWGQVHQAEDWVVKRQQREFARFYFTVDFFGTSRTGRKLHRHLRRRGWPEDDTVNLSLEIHRLRKGEGGKPPGRTPPQPTPTNNYYTTNNYYYNGSGHGPQQQANNMPSPV